MKKFMIVYVYADEETKDSINSAYFTDSRAEAHNCVMDITCGFGGQAQVYGWDDEEECYTFLWE